MLRSFGWAVAAFFIGAAFLIFSQFIGILSVQSCWQDGFLVACSTQHELRKEVGFASAINWSLGLIFLFPAFIYCDCETYNHAQHAIAEMVARRMIVNDRWEPVAEADIQRILRRQRLFLALCLVAVLGLGAIFLVDDFIDVVLDFYRNPTLMQGMRLTDPVLEIDWSVAAPACRFLEPSCPISDFATAENMYFAAIAYVYLTWFGAALAIGFMIAVLTFAASFLSADFRSNRIMLVPDVTSQDPRRGFEVLENFFQFAIAGCFMLFAMGYLVTLQNVYLRTRHENLLQLIFPFIQPNGDLSVDGMLQGMLDALRGQLGLINPNIVAVVVIGLLFLLLMLTAVAVILRLTARRGLAALETALGTQNKEEKARLSTYLGGKGSSIKASKEALNKLVVWPVNWLRLNTLFGWLVAATLSLILVTLGAYIMSAGIGFMLRALLRRLEAGFNRPPQQTTL